MKEFNGLLYFFFDQTNSSSNWYKSTQNSARLTSVLLSVEVKAMKLFVVFAVLLVSALASPAPNPFYVEPGFANADTYEEFLEQLKNTGSRVNDDQKIASGTAAKKGEFNDFCYLSISFFQKSQTCGCYIAHPQYVVTSARCVKE